MTTSLLTPRLTVAQVAVILAVSEKWVRQAARTKEVPAQKIGHLWRFNPDELELWLASKRNRPPMTMTALSAKRQAKKH